MSYLDSGRRKDQRAVGGAYRSAATGRFAKVAKTADKRIATIKKASKTK